MKKFLCILPTLALLFSLFACTMNVDQPLSVTPFSVSPTSPVFNGSNSTPSSEQTVPVTWANLNLTGSLIYGSVLTGNNIPEFRVEMLDLASGRLKTLFAATNKAWIYYFSMSPDATQLLMAYIPPSQSGAEVGSGIYTLLLENANSPQLLFSPPTLSDHYIQAEWSPDGKYIYFTHYNYGAQSSQETYPHYEIYRMAYPDGQPQKILDQAFWPRLSSDSSKLVYVSLDSISGANQLFVANADGSNAQAVSLAGFSQIIDAPMFLPDGKSVLFSAPSPAQSYQPNWLDRLLGVQIAKAHSVPSDWWTVPISGGTPTRLTHLQTIKLFASLSPDQKHIASVSGEGLLLMDADGSNLNQLLFEPQISGTVNWIP